MKRIGRILLVAACLTNISVSQINQASGIAKTPPMGWNSWDSFGRNINDAEVRHTAEKVAKELKRFGWEYIVIDEGWYISNPHEQDASKFHFVMTKDGRFLPDATRFPSVGNDSGFKSLSDYIHSLGLKFGIHILRGIPKSAVRENMAIANSEFHARDAADESDICPWCTYNFGVRENAAGQAYYDSIISLYAAWGVDFLKVDCIADHPYKPGEIRMLSQAIHKAGRPIVLSLSPGPTAMEHANEIAKHSEMWRTCNDVWDHWGVVKGLEWSEGLLAHFQTAAAWTQHIAPGRWPDSDMLPLGRLGPTPGLGKPRDTMFTREEQRTMMSLWSIARSPLIMGGNLLELDDWTRSLLANEEVIAVDQHSNDNHQALKDGNLIVWTALPEKGTGFYVVVFNIGDSELNVDRAWKDIGIKEMPYRLRDLWERKNMNKANRLIVKLAPHASAMWKLQ